MIPCIRSNLWFIIDHMVHHKFRLAYCPSGQSWTPSFCHWNLHQTKPSFSQCRQGFLVLGDDATQWCKNWCIDWEIFQKKITNKLQCAELKWKDEKQKKETNNLKKLHLVFAGTLANGSTKTGADCLAVSLPFFSLLLHLQHRGTSQAELWGWWK